MKFIKIHTKITLMRESDVVHLWRLLDCSVGKTCMECPFIDACVHFCVFNNKGNESNKIKR